MSDLLQARRRGETLTQVLPYISDNGARNNGPIAKVTRKILSTIAVIVTLVMW